MSNTQSEVRKLHEYWDNEYSKAGHGPQPDSVLTLDFDGLPKSFFKDDVWDMTAHHHKSARTSFNHNYSLSPRRGEEIKHQHKLFLYFFWVKHRDSLGSFRGRVVTMNRLVRYCIANDTLPFEVLASTHHAAQFVISLDGMESNVQYETAKTLRAALGVLIRLSSIYNDLIPPVSVEVYHFLDEVTNNKMTTPTAQTKLLPSRIYVELINQSFKFLADFEANELPTIKKFLTTRRALIEEKVASRFEDAGGDLHALSKRILHLQPTVPTQMENQGAYAELAAIGLSADHQQALPSISKKMSEAQSVATMLIHAFTGMRRSEGECLPLNAFGEFDCLGNKIPTLTGYHSKFSPDSKNITSWVTAHSIKPVIDLCRSLTILAIDCLHLKNHNDFAEGSIPLNVGVSRSINKRKSGLFEFTITRKSTFDYSHVLPSPDQFLLRETDINELLEFEPLMVDDDLIVGNRWNFKSHQLRRSLAVYAARSGYVGISSLRTQFKQLGDQMAAYYADSSAFAKDLIFTDDLQNFAEEFSDELVEVEVDRIHEEVVNTQELLFGGLGNWLQKKKSNGDLPEIYTDREKTRKGVKEGRIRYKETPAGGCSKLDRCTRIAITPIFGCIDCPDAIFSDRAVSALSKTKQKLIDRLDGIEPDSVIYRTLSIEVEKIDKLLTRRDQPKDSQQQNVKEVVWHKRKED